MTDKPKSFNDKLILEAYVHGAVNPEKRVGWVTVGQKNNLKGLKVLVQARLNNGDIIPAGSTAYLKEEYLHTSPSVKNILKCDTMPGEFILVNMNEVEFIAPPSGDAA
jgi:hypothetical protein